MEFEPNKYVLQMQSEVKAISTDEYVVYAFSEEEAIRKLCAGEHSGEVNSLDLTFESHEQDLTDTIEVISCEEGALS